MQVRGSIPSFESAKLLVREDGSMIGTIGGGCVEAEVWNAAREVMETEKPKHMSFNLGQDAAYDNGLICGGQLDVFVEAVMPAAAGNHIRGRPHFEEPLQGGQSRRLHDNHRRQPREPSPTRERFPEAEPDLRRGVRRSFPEANRQRADLPHHRDTRPSRRYAGAELGRAQRRARYVAMIGSKRKVLSVVKELEKEGISREPAGAIYAPMGLEIGAISPEEIAISVAAEMIAVRRNPKSNWRGLSMSVFGDEVRQALAK